MAARLLEKTKSPKARKGVLILALFLSLGVLFVFKYFDFFSVNVTRLLNKFSFNLHPVTLKLMIPVGISFYTFQTVSYVIDVYKGRCDAEKNLGVYAAFISFFPQLVAGPIERTENLLPQIKHGKEFSYENATYGLKLMAWGFFKKIVIADHLSVIVDKVYNEPLSYTGFSLAAATVLFAFQIYCDFSGYSDIAIGTAKLFHIQLVRNFNSPYFSKSMKEFWRRWHISLSNWFRDYVYIPLGGSHCSEIRNSLNLIVTFLVSGLWHGAAGTFIVWGGIHGGLQVIENKILKNTGGGVFRTGKKENWIKSVLTVGIIFFLCCFAWIFFRASSMQHAFYIIQHMFDGCGNVLGYIRNGCTALGITLEKGIFIAFILGILFVYDYISLNNDVIEIISKKNIILRWMVYVLGILFIIFFRAVNDTQAFIYFQF